MGYVWPTLFVVVGVGIVSLLQRPKKDIKGKHVMITGGSQGIGLGVARDLVNRGASVTLVARDVAKLQTAQEELEAAVTRSGHQGKVQYFSVDLSSATDKLGPMMTDAEAAQGPIYMLVNCAGFSRAAKFEDLTQDMVKQMMEVNFYGSFFITQHVVRSMKKNMEGIIVFTSSQAGLLGLYGFSAYSASKAALVKMAEALHMEVAPYNISVTVAVPPDTDTPGFEEENKTKPLETKLISEAAGLFKADDVAKKMVDDALIGSFFTTNGLEGFMLTTLSAGMGPVTDAITFMAQVFLMGIFRSVSAFYLWSFNRIVKKEHEKRLASKKCE